jgi:hypothetical protein
MPRDKNVPRIDTQDKRIQLISELLREAAEERVSSSASFEDHQTARKQVMAAAMYLAEGAHLQELVVDEKHVEVEGVVYRRLSQQSSASYHGLWGTHVIHEQLYRDTRERGGPTIKPLELRVGMIGAMLPDCARLVGRMASIETSREIWDSLVAHGYRPPSRAFIEKHIAQMVSGLDVAALEAEAREKAPLAGPIAAVSCGMDRMAIRMNEPQPDSQKAPVRPRKRPYKRTPPPPAELNWRMALVGSVTTYDADGNALTTLRYAADADTARDAFAGRIAADVHAILGRHPGIPVVCVQDGAEDLLVLTDKIRECAANSPFYHLTDFPHLMGYLSAVVKDCELPGDPNHMHEWYRQELIHDDKAIERIYINLGRTADRLPGDHPGQASIARARRYIKDRRPNMRYAEPHAANLPIGSGATESTCNIMQLRVKRAGMSWRPPGLAGILAIRGLVLSRRWEAAWPSYAARFRRQVNAA